ncbi:hypothetical protein FACS18949_05730 [Clostridia bacterium]|nr:hypothetical protein FACS18949_05730 [Clostridia bacterium]
MAISGVGATNTYAASAAANTAPANTAPKAEDNSAVRAADSYVKSANTASTTYKPNLAKIAELDASQKAYVSNLQTLVKELLTQKSTGQQASGAVNFSPAFSGGIDPTKVTSYWDLLVDNGNGTYSFDPTLTAEQQDALIAKAQTDIGEDGYWGVKQTSGRILDFAKAITGGDPSKVALMRKMVEEAFQSVRDTAGGKLPELSQNTYDAVMKGLAEWEASSVTANVSGQASAAAVAGATAAIAE